MGAGRDAPRAFRAALVAALFPALGAGATLAAPPAGGTLAVALGDPSGWMRDASSTGALVLADASHAGFALVLAPLPASAWPEGWYAAWDHVASGADAAGDPLRARQWPLDALDMPLAWAVEPGDRGVVVAVVDSGVDASHEDLAGASVLAGPDFVDLDDDPRDASGHGTRVAGIVAAVRDNGVGVAGMADVSLLAVRVLDARDRGACAVVGLGIVAAVDRGADVVNLSVSCSSEDPALRLAVEYALRRGALVVAAAGNLQASRPQDCPTYPARWEGVIAVGAVDASLAPARTSCRGEALDLAAPGEGIPTLVPGGYGVASGTSLAAPHVSAAAALLKSLWPEASAEALRAALAGTARDLDAPGFDPATGHGLVQPAQALAAAGPSPS